MKKYLFALFYMLAVHYTCSGQVTTSASSRIFFHGLVMDAKTEIPVQGTQIIINNSLFSLSDEGGKFAFYANRRDTVRFRRLGYKPATMFVSDSLSGNEFLAGIFLQSDTILIDAVIIVPRFQGLKSDLLNTRKQTTRQMENAKYNLAVSAYQGKMNQNKLGDPATNYQVLQQKQSSSAYSKGQIPSDQIVGINPLLLIPAAYLLLHGMSEKPPPLGPQLTDQEINQIHQKYLESLRKK
jgi:hypothetical protein